MNLYMWDDTVPSLIPPDAKYIAYYTDGRYKNSAAMAKDFPHATLIGIAVDQADDADVLDVEEGDATIADIFYWLTRQLARAIARPVSAPVTYMSVSDVDSAIPHMEANGFVRGKDYLIWSAHYTGTPHLCGPDTCKATSTACDATQFTDSADGRSLDESLLSPQFLAKAAVTKPTAPAPAAGITLRLQAADGKTQALSLEAGTYTLTVTG